jgi:hypothetical protein
MSGVIVVSSNAAIGEAIEEIWIIGADSESADWDNRVEFVPF